MEDFRLFFKQCIDKGLLVMWIYTQPFTQSITNDNGSLLQFITQSENATVFQISLHYLDFPFCCSLFFFYHKRKLKAKRTSFKIILTAVYKSFEYTKGRPKNKIPTPFSRFFTLSLKSYSFCNCNVAIDFRCLCYWLFFLCVTNDNGSPTRTIHQTIEETP